MSLRRNVIEFLFTILILNVLIFSTAPMNSGPDRVIHSPLVNRVLDANFLENDWFVNTAANSGVHYFYGKLIGIGGKLSFEVNFWEDILFFSFLQILIISLSLISYKLFKKFAPILIIFTIHFFIETFLSTQFDYGPYFPFDMGNAPRAISMPLGFLSLFFLMEKKYTASTFFLGISTLIHPSNGLLVAIILLGSVFLLNTLKAKRISLANVSLLLKNFMLYVTFGGFFAVYLALSSFSPSEDYNIDKFIWGWIYLRCPYLDIIETGLRVKIAFSMHFIIHGLIGYHLLLKENNYDQKIIFIWIVGLIGNILFLVFFFSLYFFPNQTIFSLYSFRTIYLSFFSLHCLLAYFFLEMLKSFTLDKHLSFLNSNLFLNKNSFLKILILIICVAPLLYTSWKGNPVRNIKSSIVNFGSTLKIENDTLSVFLQNTENTILINPKTIVSSDYYIPTYASFKNFLFTPMGMFEWLKRMDTLCNGQIEMEYIRQKNNNKFEKAMIDWNECVTSFPDSEIKSFMEKNEIHFLLEQIDDRTPQRSMPIFLKNDKYNLYRLE